MIFLELKNPETKNGSAEKPVFVRYGLLVGPVFLDQLDCEFRSVPTGDVDRLIFKSLINLKEVADLG